jgi:hypothetical protein
MDDEPKLSAKTLAEMEAGRRALAAKQSTMPSPPPEPELPPEKKSKKAKS